MDNDTKNEQTQNINEQPEVAVQPAEPEVAVQPVEPEVVAQPVEPEVVAQPVEPEVVVQPVESEVVVQQNVAQPVEQEVVAQPVESEVVVQTENVVQPVESESKETENKEEEKSDNNTNNSVDVNMVNIAETNLMAKSDLEIILYFLQNDVKLKELISKLNIDLDDQCEKKLNGIINFLSKNNVKFDNNPPIKKIIDEIKIVFADGKMDLQDIPNLISIITNILNLNMNSIKFSIDTNTISILIKLLINILIIEKVIKVNDIEQQMINRLIDSSLLLLNTTIARNKVKCSCLPFCNKKN
jgi:hypothetical protein